MLIELTKPQFEKCKSIINEQGQLEVKAIVYGVNPGRIFVDNKEQPTSGIVWLGDNDGFLFIGDENNEVFNSALNSFIDTFIKIEANKVGLHYFEAIGNHAGWNETIEKVFSNRSLKTWNQKVYLSQNTTPLTAPKMQERYTVVKITEELLQSKDISNVEFLQNKIKESWQSVQTFLNQGIGYCILFKNEIVSVCISRFVVEKQHAIAIETLKEHQWKKLGEQVAVAYVNACLESGLQVYWDCMEDNIPSVKLAEKLGLQNTYNYKGYYFAI